MNLKPVTIINARYPRYRQNTSQQVFLLNALKITQDPKKLKDMIGVKKVADVFRTLDKLAMRKEYHSALSKVGIDFNFIARGLASEAMNADKAGDRIKVYQTLLKSLGMDKYEESDDGGGAQWEELLTKKIEEEKKQLPEEDKKLQAPDMDRYVVIQPKIPDSVKKKLEKEKELGESLYG